MKKRIEVARPREENPTAGELEVLKTVWERGPCTVRDVMNVLNKQRTRAYTSVMSLMNVMTEKGLLTRRPHGRAFLYEAKHPRDSTLGSIVRDLLGRAFDGSASAMVAHLLSQATLSTEELDEIREAIDEYQQQEGR